MKTITKLLSIMLAVFVFFSTTANSHDHKSPLQTSVQLWSVKEDLKSDFKGTLTKIAAMGFDGVEFAREFGPYANDAKGLKNLLDELGLKVSGAHIKFTSFTEENIAETVAFYQTLDTDVLLIGWDTRAWDPKLVGSLVDDLLKLAKDLEPYDIQTGFHNHDREFETYKNSTFWDYIAKSTTENMILQLDIGWVTLAGADPVKYIKRYPGRTLTTHIKAKLPKGYTGEARPIIGEDLTDWPAVITAELEVGGTQWFVVEQEEYPDGLTPLQAVKLSKQGFDKIVASMNIQ